MVPSSRKARSSGDEEDSSSSSGSSSSGSSSEDDDSDGKQQEEAKNEEDLFFDFTAAQVAERVCEVSCSSSKMRTDMLLECFHSDVRIHELSSGATVRQLPAA